jgi:hypothetical protein
LSAATWSGFSSEQGWTETSGAAAVATSHDFDSSLLSLLNTETKEFPASFVASEQNDVPNALVYRVQLNPPSWNFSPG